MRGAVMIESISIDHTPTGYAITINLYFIFLQYFAPNWIDVCLSVVRDRSSAPKDFEVYGIVDAGRGVARYANDILC